MTTGRINQVTIRVHVGQDCASPHRQTPPPEGGRSRFTKRRDRSGPSCKALAHRITNRVATTGPWPVDATRVESTVRRVDDATPISPVAPCETVATQKSLTARRRESDCRSVLTPIQTLYPLNKPGNAKPEPYNEATAPGTPHKSSAGRRLIRATVSPRLPRQTESLHTL